jgi:uncharacterized spore protein YtfJ
MSDKFDDIVATAVKSQEQGVGLMEKLMAVAQPGAVYSEPLASGEYTVITASEVSVGMGFGFGTGGGTVPGPAKGETAAADEPESQEAEGGGFGGGGGGGGFSMGRPVAVISIGPAGVQVQPVRDVTKIALAFLTAAGSMLFMLSRMRRLSRF